VNWFKLVGATESQVADDWDQKEPHNFTMVYFPWNKPPRHVCRSDRIVLYAVGAGALMATQIVDAPPRLKQRRGPIRSSENRWPHSIEVRTLRYCSPLATAPKLREAALDFAKHYSKRFRNGSHWQITDEEYEQLAAAIDASGRVYRSDAH
jgi:hypothetical protein